MDRLKQESYIIFLVIFCLFASGLFALDEADLKDVLPVASSFKAVQAGKDVIYYKAEDKEGRLIGACFKVIGKGYFGKIETLVGMLKDGTINAIKVLSLDETPGLGARVSEPQFTNQFRHLKDISSVQAITGATVSSQAVIDSVKKRAQEIEALLKDDNA